VFRINEDLDAAGGPWLPPDEPYSFERQHHLVDRRRAHAKVLLHVGFGWRPAVQARVEVDKGQILALLGREGFCVATQTGHPIQLFVRASNEEEARMNVRYRVELSQTERNELTALLSGGKHAARKLKRAQILLAADAGAGDEEIARSVGVGGSTVYRTKRRFVLGNLEAALREEPRPGASRKLSGKEEALLVATACSKPPAGRARWTLVLLAGELVKLTEHDGVSRETVRRRLAENDLKPWRKDMWCIPKVEGEYVARMEDVLDLYAEEPDPKRPVVCFDESPTQLIGEVRQPIPAAPGQLERYDCEYKRNGTANLFIFLDVHRSWRRVKVTDSRAAVDFAACMRELTDVHFPKAERIRVVLDNLSTHSAGALYQAFPAAEARRVLRRLEFHYVPKHASWLNMVEIEIGVLRGQCLDRRIATQEQLVSEIAAWEKQRNASADRIKWMFTTAKARAKMGRAYPEPAALRDPRAKES
jgi:transposase